MGSSQQRNRYIRRVLLFLLFLYTVEKIETKSEESTLGVELLLSVRGGHLTNMGSEPVGFQVKNTGGQRRQQVQRP
jgi:hypothetical protein